MAHPPSSSQKTPADFGRGKELCPTKAIRDNGIAQGSCIRCARCTAAGFRFQSVPDLSMSGEENLFWSKGSRPKAGPKAAPAPLPDFQRSLHVFIADVGSCNACNLEVLALANPYYDSQRLGIFFTNSPRHADVILVVGIPTTELVEPLRRAYEAIPFPKVVVAVGACSIDGGIFIGSTGIQSPLRDILPVDVFVPGCPPAPVAVLGGLIRATGRSATKEDRK